MYTPMLNLDDPAVKDTCHIVMCGARLASPRRLTPTVLGRPKENAQRRCSHLCESAGIINFYVSADATKNPPRKPLFAFLQGSQPRPILQVQRAPDGSNATFHTFPEIV